ncbi:hypothetical protein Ga0061079_10488 [Apibacter mensalis]|uniref:Uncharacterized protein n=1 Tax=Apibacter mensalis TaxID=1586267 RepID=A0A0X3ANL0_9FLAO|nr:hypothetical protein [Apibacter mensalis]CVK15970.1 hypothetical protein Ga0061079_10488 [Apibacter mensalis]
MVWGDNLDVENLEYQPGDFLEIYFTLYMETGYIRSNDTQSKVKKSAGIFFKQNFITNN